MLWPPRGHLPRLEAPARWSVVQPQGRDLTGATVAVIVDGRAVQAPVVASGRDRLVFEPRITANPKDGADPREDITVDVDVTAASDGSHVRYRSTLASFAPRGSERVRELVVTAWYDRFLGRPFDPNARYWTERLRADAPADVLWSIAHTDERHRDEVWLMYFEHLGRELDGGAQYWVEGVSEGKFPIEWALQNVLASAEYQRLHRGERGLVLAWYRAVLGKATSSVTDGALR